MAFSEAIYRVVLDFQRGRVNALGRILKTYYFEEEL